MNLAIHTENLSRHFGRVEAVRGLNLDVPEGAIYALVGPNGAGKTTTLKILMNIIRASQGRAEVLGVESAKLSPTDLARIGYVSENQEMPEWMTVRYLLRYLKPFYPTWDDARAAELVKELNLPQDRKLRALSRGMRMKAALASSLAYHPQLIVLDEPFTGLDALVRDELVQGLLEGAEQATILVSSHDLAEIESFASHVGYLEDGMLRFSEEMNSLVQRFREVEVTFDAPPALPAALPRTWLQANTSAAVLRFIESRFDQQRTMDEVRHLFPSVRDVTFSAMSFRAIFVALAKTAQRTS